jgi:hypothetical protein
VGEKGPSIVEAALHYVKSRLQSRDAGEGGVFDFLQQVPDRAPIYWVTGQDPTLCARDSDCNLTIVNIRRLTN